MEEENKPMRLKESFGKAIIEQIKCCSQCELCLNHHVELIGEKKGSSLNG